MGIVHSGNFWLPVSRFGCIPVAIHLGCMAMIFYTPISNAKAAKDYYTQHLAPGDYYAAETQELKGVWHGRGAERLGLSGEVQREDYFALCDNVNPKTGEQLTPRTKDGRRVMFDLTLDAPKDV